MNLPTAARVLKPRMNRLKKLLLPAMLVTAFLVVPAAADSSVWRKPLARCDVIWNEPSTNSLGSMPLGNGDIGVNVWVESGGDLLLLLAKTDAWSENAQLLKLGRVRVRLTPNPFQPGQSFQQRLHLATGEIVITAGTGPQAVTLRVWVDANHPVVQVDLASESKFEVQADLEVWRTTRREIKAQERHSVYGLYDSPAPVFSEPDQIAEAGADRVVWYHRNERSIWSDNLKLQALGDLTRSLSDPLLHRTFGGTLRGEGLTRLTPTALKSGKPQSTCHLTVSLLTSHSPTPGDWLKEMAEVTERSAARSAKSRLSAHRHWWNYFWSRSYIFVSGDSEAERVTLGYNLQRFLNACAGRGALPIKFNGSLFTVETPHEGKRFDADFRLWGGPYWFQNTRLPYWSMLAAGDFDLMQPLFQMYTNSLPLARHRTQLYYGHAGAFWPETMYFWGTYNDDNYGRDRQGLPDGLTTNRYIRYYWQSGLELVMIMLDTYDYIRDEQFLQTALLPIATNVTTFFDEHWARDARGKIRFDPAMALETYHVAVNPAPEIAGLRAVLPRLLALPAAAISDAQRARWQRTLADLPELPLAGPEGEKVLSPAEQFSAKANIENPELYAVFPYRLYGVGRPDLDVALRTFAQRIHKGTGGWQQDPIQAARLGLATEAARMVVGNFSRKNPACRFPAFWGPNYDWTPDQDHGSVPMIALQQMLLQSDSGKLRLLPAWPKHWDVQFKLHGPGQTTVAAEFRDGKVLRSEVRPARRAQDLVLP